MSLKKQKLTICEVFEVQTIFKGLFKLGTELFILNENFNFQLYSCCMTPGTHNFLLMGAIHILNF